MHEVLVNHLGGLSLPRKSVVRLTDCPDMTLDVYHGRKTTIQQQYNNNKFLRRSVLKFCQFEKNFYTQLHTGSYALAESSLLTQTVWWLFT